MQRDPQDVAEAHRRFQLDLAHRRIEGLSQWPARRLVQGSPTMKLTLHNLMVGSHAYRRPLDG